MNVSKLQSNRQSFKSLYYANKLAQKMADDATSTKFLIKLNTVKNHIVKNKLDKKKFVDIILHENNNDFFAVISSKKQGTPYNPNAEFQIETTKKGLAKFKKWVNEWNQAYNPKTLNELKRLDELIRNADDFQFSDLAKALKEIQ